MRDLTVVRIMETAVLIKKARVYPGHQKFGSTKFFQSRNNQIQLKPFEMANQFSSNLDNVEYQEKCKKKYGLDTKKGVEFNKLMYSMQDQFQQKKFLRNRTSQMRDYQIQQFLSKIKDD
eukprot:403334761